MLKYLHIRCHNEDRISYKRFGGKRKSRMGQGLKHVGGNIRKGITGFSGAIISKSKGLAHLRKHKFGSAVSIGSVSRSTLSCAIDDDASQSDRVDRKDNDISSSASLHASNSGDLIRCSSAPGSENSSYSSDVLSFDTRDSAPSSNCYSLEPIFTEMQRRREEFDKIQEEVEVIKQTVQQEITLANQTLYDQRSTCEQLEEQVLDLSRLHHMEFEHLKQTISDLEEKVQYQREERLCDIRELLECCQNKISKMELQQQQCVTLEGIDSSNARVLVVKLINVLLTVLQLVLLLSATAAGIAMPFLCTRLRILSTSVLGISSIILVQYWPSLKVILSYVLPSIKDFQGEKSDL